MKLPVPFIRLPLSFDAQALAAEIAAIDEGDWRPHPQGFPGNSMLPLVAVKGDPADEGFAGPMAPTEHLRRCPYLTQGISDTRPHPYLQAVGAASQRFTRVWQGLWFRYGERAEGHPAYRQAFQTYHDEIYRAAQHLLLINEIRWYAAMMSMIGKVAVIDDASAGHPDAARQRELGDNA